MRTVRKKVSKKDRERIYSLCAGHCAYCGCEIAPNEMQVDHFIPMELDVIARMNGGEADCVDNMLPACRPCNYIKSSYTLEKFREAVWRWTDSLSRDSVTYRNAVRFGQVTPTRHFPQFYFEKIGVHIPAMDWYAKYEAGLEAAERRFRARKGEEVLPHEST